MDNPSRPLRVLLVEDNANDAELVMRELRRAGFNPDCRRVDTEEEFSAALNPNLDVILSDYAMPRFSGLGALQILKESGLKIPFIIVSGTIGEETAVAAIRNGAADYLLKDRLARLGPAIDQALTEKQIRLERRQTAEALERLQRLHELILNSAAEGIHGLDSQGRIIFENPKAAELLGWTAEELIGKTAHSTIHHTRADGSAYPIEECPICATTRNGIRRVTNDVFWRKNGSSFRVDYVAAPIKDADGNVLGTIVTFKDITEQFAAHARLELQEQQYRLLFQTNPSPMWVFDVATLRILAANDAAIAQYGYSEDEFLQLTIRDLRLPEDMSELDKALSPPQAHAHFSGEFRHKRKDGSIIIVGIYSSAVVWNGASARMVTGIDVTERKQTEESLREKADIINRAHDGIIVRDFESDRITMWNMGAENLYGWTASEAVGQPLRELIATEGTDHDALRRQLISTGEFHGEIKDRTKDGREVIVDLRATLIRNSYGTPKSVLGINTDITEQKMLETQLLRTQRLESIGTLASGVAHDLNNILTPILMCAEVLRDKITDVDANSTISLIDDSARRGAAIVKQVLTFARGVEGERVLIKPAHLIEEMVDIARKTFPKSIEITARYPEDLRTIEADPTQLHQVLLNLSVNARDAMPNGGQLTISGENFDVEEDYASIRQDAKIGPYVIFTVSDTGAGMAKANIDKIFDPFFTTKEIGKGTGLGLSTALGIVKSHDGFISVKSEPGSGTTFKVFLPAQVHDQPDTREKTRPDLLEGHGQTILVVDDEPTILAATQMILEKNNYRVLVANDGQEALATLAEHGAGIDVVLTDLSMPHMDGIAVVRETRKIKPDSSFIVTTGEGDQNRLNELEALNIANFLSKPFSSEKLLSVTRAALESRGSDR
jgi:PAS domain S-box-containing protein